MPINRMLQALPLALAGAMLAAAPAAAEPPKRVVSMNVCTDQLAMLLAGAGQLHSVSYLARDPDTSVLAERARGLVVNHGLAEEVFLMQPDMVLAGTYTTRSTVALLRRLGIRVEEFAPDNSIAEIRSNILRMGEVLERRERAAELVADLDRGVAELAARPASDMTVATYYANSYTSGAGTLVDDIVKLSGLVNVADRLGLSGTARLPLEMLVLAQPDLIAGGGERYDAPALAQENFVHPAYRAIAGQDSAVPIPARFTICGAPFTLEAARLLRDAAAGKDGIQ
ncbi:corrinoid ABC transporter substrate-binding protein [Aminobacter sp. MSH1]|uniref:ABC transporter substrate-binding protein n=1 Tax=Aminobacter sp. MSH1 TaxID=374606 RepID=UPI000D33F87A|nr:ABC transporter substrate-binding protein [Aminobacter sp. MSH1]AWC21190.1 corrinoid ABC transporter substrate-binding protein [Aminobacter sp. MSH1]